MVSSGRSNGGVMLSSGKGLWLKPHSMGKGGCVGVWCCPVGRDCGSSLTALVRVAVWGVWCCPVGRGCGSSLTVWVRLALCGVSNAVAPSH
jgi:hypothetical protein